MPTEQEMVEYLIERGFHIRYIPIVETSPQPGIIEKHDLYDIYNKVKLRENNPIPASF